MEPGMAIFLLGVVTGAFLGLLCTLAITIPTNRLSREILERAREPMWTLKGHDDV